MLPMATGLILWIIMQAKIQAVSLFFAGDSMPCYSLKNFIIDLVNVFSLKFII
ncbi:hypothetical protein BANRA_00031 [Klebsiella pneumoniae]|nr:hypothetical protein BANRA_00031 [Klebsiella pneumoniae]